MLDTIEAKSSPNRLQLLKVKVPFELFTHGPQVIQVANMQEAVLGRVVVEAGLDGVIVVKPVEHRLPRKLDCLEDLRIQSTIELTVGFKNVPCKGERLRIESVAGDIIVAYRIVGGDS